MAIEGIFYIRIHVSDLTRSKRFYGETLGWKIGTDEPQAAGFSFGSAYLVVLQDARPASERRYGGGMNIAVRVSDLETEHARLKDRGVGVGEIRTYPWNECSFSFADPDGYLWAYGQQRS